ncbi:MULTISPECIES: N-acetylmuramoyl-L-alanine amidase [Bacillus]|uniref:N-acetylmuramoyl-L-alanine amidase n=3 Tax=Bacillus thuringiensis TaxID=1428 RepID=A0AAP4V0V8_BACTU|nr:MULTISPECIES: N-acetylmuramoyl-L-alanine amidase [Bacillus]MEC2873679.1 N-acetylmuramoyl-L-alanine amidase [Bacillus cereus]AEA18372.1 N-acetylmuramoyl-L-alanine amidase [Bacillus thuringiensis serovar chinensis CT-43]AFV20523.1 N-acetylmuramoyl-L-alanine amidase [Bacillus thuringiensis Bt407]AGG03500.1 N-acetylmuramoyl-L-alanine amidase [Bacillus thuringiensis serovar thuringiensis str. IS5056]EEM26860.1 N-acetylmuramoyl-L-alanine amidase [Bacillus thuringiensis Bt407]
MKYIKIMSMIVFIGIYMAGCSQEQPKKETTSSIQEKNKDTKEDAPVEKQQEQEKNEESQVEHRQEKVSAEEKKEETTPVQPIEQPVQNNEQKVESNEKKGKFLVVIDPGHQQKANLNLEPIGPGATTQKYKVTDGTTGVVTKKREAVLVLEMAFLLKEKLEAKGIQVLMTRISQDVDISNKERATFANNHKANLFLRLHADGSENPNQSGFAVLTPAEGSPYTKEIYAESLQISQTIVNKMRENQQVKVNGIKFRDDLSGFNWSKVPGVLLELGFMSNYEEDKKLSDPQYVNSLLQSVTDSVDAYRKSKA